MFATIVSVALSLALAAIGMMQNRRKKNWGVQLGFFVAATALSASSITWEVATHVLGKPKPTSGIIDWRGGAIDFCFASFDGFVLKEYADKYNAVLVCGIDRPAVDHMADAGITVSGKYSIESRAVAVETPISQRMHAAIDEVTSASLRDNPPPPGMKSTVTMTLWYELVLLPKRIDPAELKSLDRVTQLGGVRFTERHGTALIREFANVQAVKP